MTAQDTAGRGIVDLDARAVEATVSLVKQAGWTWTGRRRARAGTWPI